MKTCRKGHEPFADSNTSCPMCKKENRKKYYEKNKEKERANSKKWQEENREYFLAQKRSHRAEDQEGRKRWYENRLRKRPYDNIWRGMIDRCYDQNHHKYPTYGARGITVCARWLGDDGYDNFEKDMGPRPSSLHSVDRRNNDKNYEPDNCGWATKKAQQRNRRVNANVTINGKIQCVSAWAEELSIKRTTFQRRLDLGWTGERLLRTTDQKFNRLRNK